MLILRGHSGPVLALAYSPDGRLLASGGDDRTVRLWDMRQHQQVAVLRGHLQFVAAVAFSPDGATLASADLDRHVRLWDVASGRERADLPRQSGRLTALAFFPDGRSLAVGVGLVSCLAISPDGATVAAGCDYPLDFNRGAVAVWDVESLRNVVTLELTDMGRWSAVYRADGRRVELGGGVRAVKLWEPASERRLPALPHREGVRAVAYAPDGATLASAAGAIIKLWDAATGRERAALRGHAREVEALAFSADGGGLLSGSADRSVRVWDVAGGRQRVAHGWPVGKVYAVAASPDGLTAAAAGDASDIVVWDVDE